MNPTNTDKIKILRKQSLAESDFTSTPLERVRLNKEIALIRKDFKEVIRQDKIIKFITMED